MAACIAVPLPNGEAAEYYEAERRDVKVPPGKLNPTCYEIAQGLLFGLGVGTKLTPATKWKLPQTSGYCVDLPCEAAGYAMVAGRLTLKARVQGREDTDDVLRSMAAGYELLRKRNAATGEPYPEVPLHSELNSVRNERLSKKWDIVVFLDVRTGLVVREETNVVHFRGESPGESRWYLKQAIET